MLRCSAGLRAASPLLAPYQRHGASHSGAAPLPAAPVRRLARQAPVGGAAPGRRRRCSLQLPCAARMTSSRGSIDEDQLELQRGGLGEGSQQQLAASSSPNGSGRGALPGPPTAAAQQQEQQQQQPALGSGPQQGRQLGAEQSQQPGEPPPGDDYDGGGSGGVPQPHPLTLKQLQALTELHVEDAYACGVVGSAAELVTCLGTDLQDGLCEDQERLAARAARYGTNTTRPPKEVTFLQLVVEALKDFTILVLLGAGCLSLGLELLVNRKAGGESSWIEGASILAAVCVVVLVTAVNNYQKERQFRMLQAVSSDVQVRAIRNGREVELPVRDVLVGDLLLVETGDILCTDGLLVAGCDVKVDESHLTGESDDVSKDPHTRPTLLGGSKVLSGFGRMLVTAVGPNSQSGRIAEMVADGKTTGAAAAAAGMATAAGDGLREETLLQQKLAEYATSIGQFGLGAAVLATLAMTARFSFETFVIEQAAWDWAFLQDYLRFFITGVTILVVAVPEGLPLAVTLALAFSVRRMLADHNLVRHLSAAETMGTATVVCSDKTGTLTQNNMVVSKLWLAGHLLPDLKPYTRKSQQAAASGAQRPWERAAKAGAAAGSGSGGSGKGAGSKAAGGRAAGGKAASGKGGSGGGSSGGGTDLPPLLQVVTSQGTISSICGSASMDAVGAGSRASILESITAGSQAPADIVELLLESISLNSTANIYTDKDGQERRIGNRTEIALLELARLLGASPRKLRRQQRQLAQVAFSSERKRMTTAAIPPGQTDDTGLAARLCRIYTKGAPEIVLERCTYVLGPDGCRRRLTEDDKAALVREFGQGGQRVLALAYRDITVPAETVGPPAPVPAEAAWQTMGGRLTGSDSDDRSSSGSEEGSRSSMRSAPSAPTGTISEEGGWRWDPASLNAVLSSSDESDAAWDDGLPLADNLESNLTLLAVVGIQDPLRPEVPAAILQCQASGITVKMLTGDNIGTATAIAQECGILPPAGTSMDEWLRTHCAATEATAKGAGGWFRDPTASGSSIVVRSSGASLLSSVHSVDSHSKTVDHEHDPEGHCGLPEGVVMEGAEFRQRVLNEDGSINSAEFLRLWPRLRVLARCTPADKYTIVTGVRSLTNDVVAVTGDGTNDAPALRAANVGFAMNVGTDTAKEAADIVLLDNNFASIVSAVLWGRNVYCNITRFLQFQLTINLVAVATAVTGAIVATESPLTAVQMLWVNMIMDSLASLALATEPPDTRILALPPFSQEHDFVDPHTPTVKHIAGQALYQLAVMYGLIFYAPALLGIPDHSMVTGPSEHYTMVFNTFVFMQLFNQMNARKIIDSSLAWEGLSNAHWFQSILAGELLLQILIVQFGGQWFHTHPLNATEWAVCVGLGATTLGLREILRRVPYGRWWFSLEPRQ